jgi:CubicO group peptidase (beta-lactamase class C family)
MLTIAALALSGALVDPSLRFADDLIESGLAKTGTPGAALVVVRDGRLVHARGYGMADAEARTPATADTVWPLASVTKVLTALALMQLVDRGKVALDADVNKYLKRARVPPTYPAPITIADLLRHTSGLDELPGRRFERAQDVPSFADFMASRLVRHRPAGELTSYSSYGMALAGLVVEEVSGTGYEPYLEAHLFRPLAMTSARVMNAPGEEAGVATPYEIDDGKAARMDYEWYATPPAASAVVSVRDFGQLLAALTRNEPRIVSRQALDRMMATQATLHPAVPGWGYGFQLDEMNGRRIAEHGGDIGGFASLMTVVPEERFAFFVVHHGEGSSLRFQVREALLRNLLPEPAPKPVPARGVDLQPYAGTYRASYACHTCSDPPPVPEFEVEVNDDGTLTLWGSRWLPVQKDVFAREDGRAKLAFRRNRSGAIEALSGGSWRVGERPQSD